MGPGGSLPLTFCFQTDTKTMTLRQASMAIRNSPESSMMASEDDRLVAKAEAVCLYTPRVEEDLCPFSCSPVFLSHDLIS